MPRYRITIEYDGTPFIGWQVQKDGASIQGRLAQAIKAFSSEDVLPSGAGRTDAGVHAFGQVAHFDLVKDWPSDTVRDALNFHLKPDPIVILNCAQTDEAFDARFSAIARHYLYRIIVRRSPLALDRGRAWQVYTPLDAKAMHEAAQALIGSHDFTTFRSVHCQAKSPVKTMDVVSVHEEESEIRIMASAPSFMHHQVRSIVGSLKLVGEGKWPVGQMASVLEARDRTACGPVAPAHGLYLLCVDYDIITTA